MNPTSSHCYFLGSSKLPVISCSCCASPSAEQRLPLAAASRHACPSGGALSRVGTAATAVSRRYLRTERAGNSALGRKAAGRLAGLRLRDGCIVNLQDCTGSAASTRGLKFASFGEVFVSATVPDAC